MKKTQMLVFMFLVCGLTISCTKETKVSFNQQVMPILTENCFPCHQAGGIGELASGLNLENYQNLMKGANNGPVVQSGQSFASTLHVLVDHKASGEINMPKGSAKLPIEKIETIGRWIDQGALDD